MGTDLELTPRAVFGISKSQYATRTIALANVLGSNTVDGTPTMTIYNSSGTDVTTNYGEGVSISSTTLTFGVYGYDEGTFTIIFAITCSETTPDGNALTFPVEVVLEIEDTAKSATSTAAETLASYALISLNDVKASINIAFATTSYDNALILMINDVTAFIESGSMCNRRFKQATYSTETHNGSGEQGLWVKNPPIISVSAVTIDNESQSEATDYDDSDGYWIEPVVRGHKMIGMLYREDGWDKGFQNVEVTYSGGYATIPYDVRRAAIILIKELYNSYQNKQGYNPGKNIYTNDFYSKKALALANTFLAPYKRIPYL